MTTETPMIEPGAVLIDPRRLVRSPYNRPIDEATLPELAASIKSLGILQAIVARPLPASRLEDTAGMDPRPSLEIVCGERRQRAALLGELELVPVRIRELTDAQAIEAQLVENLQREGLHPLDECASYERLIDEAGVRQADVAEKVGKSTTYVNGRLKLRNLTSESREAFRAGKIDASKAELLASVPDPKLQAKALAVFSDDRSYRECKAWLRDNVLLKIKEAPFDLADKKLVKAAGACNGCDKRSSVDRDLFAAADGPELCLDPVCYRGKEAAHLAAIRKAAGVPDDAEVIAGKEAQRLKQGDEIKGYTRADAKHDDGKGRLEPLSTLLPDLASIVFVDPDSQRAIKVLPTDLVKQALKARGLVAAPPPPAAAPQAQASAPAEPAEETEAERKTRIEREIEESARDFAIKAIRSELHRGALSAFSAPLLRLLLVDVLLLLTPADCARLAALWLLPDGSGVIPHAEAAIDTALGPLLLQALIVRSDQRGQHYLEQLAKETAVDLEAIRKAVRDDIRGRETPQVVAPAPPGAMIEAAPQGSVRAKMRERGRKVTAAIAKDRAAPQRSEPRRTMSAEDARQGIAAAMQGDEAGPGGELQDLELRVPKEVADVVHRIEPSNLIDHLREDADRQLAEILLGMPHVDDLVLATLQAAGLADPRKILELEIVRSTGGPEDLRDEAKAVLDLAGATGLEVDQAAELLAACKTWPWATVLASKPLIEARDLVLPGPTVQVLGKTGKPRKTRVKLLEVEL